MQEIRRPIRKLNPSQKESKTYNLQGQYQSSQCLGTTKTRGQVSENEGTA